MKKLKELLLAAIQDSYVNLNPSENDNMWVIDCEVAGTELDKITQQIAVEFHAWMRKNDTEENAEKYANFTDEDMFQEFLKTKQ